MRIIVFFDLPTETAQDRREYNRFRKYLIKSGFIMMQESVYSKIALNGTGTNTVIDAVKRHRPAKGLVQVLSITEKQYANIEFIVGSHTTDVVNSTDRYIEI